MLGVHILLDGIGGGEPADILPRDADLPDDIKFPAVNSDANSSPAGPLQARIVALRLCWCIDLPVLPHELHQHLLFLLINGSPTAVVKRLRKPLA